jgi:multidrug efflux pump subunit AcrA (membrane-fusion protein)
MNSDKIVYWVALGVFVLGISHEYREGKFPAAHRVVSNAETTLCRLATRAEQTMAMAKLIVNPPAAVANHGVFVATSDFGAEQVEMLRDQARDQAELVREQVQAQAEILRARAELRRAEIEQMRRTTESQFHFSHAADRHVMLICPKTGARVAVKVNPPDVEVSDNF